MDTRALQVKAVRAIPTTRVVSVDIYLSPKAGTGLGALLRGARERIAAALSDMDAGAKVTMAGRGIVFSSDRGKVHLRIAETKERGGAKLHIKGSSRDHNPQLNHQVSEVVRTFVNSVDGKMGGR